jgi:hypothetical protein
MLVHMARTTLIIDDAIMKRLRNLAHREGRRLSEVVNGLLAEGLQRRKDAPKSEFELPVHAMGKPKVNLGDRNALEALMDS